MEPVRGDPGEEKLTAQQFLTWVFTLLQFIPVRVDIARDQFFPVHSIPFPPLPSSSGAEDTQC